MNKISDTFWMGFCHVYKALLIVLFIWLVFSFLKIEFGGSPSGSNPEYSGTAHVQAP